MESATTWIKRLFAIKSRHKPPPPPPSDDFGRNPYITPAQAAWLTSFYSEPDTEQGIRARAVAAATAAAADAAVAAARAAYEAVRVTTETATPLGGSRENWAAMNIQRVFRGFLARKALRALKGLVKIQAQVRGFLVRKRAAATLQSMEALVRAQASVRAKKIDLRPQFRTPKSLDNGHESPKIVEVDTWCRPKSRSNRVVISNWITESMSMEDRFRQPPSWHECSITNMPRYYYSRDISPTWRARSAMPKTRPVRSESAPKSRKGSLREVMGCRMKGRDEEAVDFKKVVTGKLGVN